jgi:hypothetical protein
MKTFKLPLLLLISLCSFFGSRAQSFQIPDSLPKTKDDFVQSEPVMIKLVDWYESTPLDVDQPQRKVAGAYIIGWINNSPTVTVSLTEKIVPISKKNPELLIGFMGGWTRYSLQHNYSKDAVQCNLAGLRCMFKMYMASLDHGIKRNKDIEKLQALDQSGGLRDYVVKQLAS